LNELVGSRKFAEVCGRAIPHHFSLRGIQLKAFGCTPTIHFGHTASELSSHLADLWQLVVFGTLHIVSKDMMAETMPQEDIGGVFG
jgi:hypothetical protein